MTKDELLIKIYNYPLANKASMTIIQRCELQRLITEALKYQMDDTDRANLEHHSNRFIDDILILVSSLEMSVATQIATISMATDKIAKKFDVVKG